MSSLAAEVMDAKVSGREVPMATMVMAVVASGMPSQPLSRLETPCRRLRSSQRGWRDR